MHVVILGAGALGTLVGARLWQGGRARVTLIGRGPHLEESRRAGIRMVEADGAESTIAGPGLQWAASPDEVEPEVDHLIFAVKGTGFEAALDAARRLPTVGCVLTLQNGVRFDESLQSVFGEERVAGAVTMEGAAMVSPGVIRHLLAATTYLGEFDGRPTARLQLLAAALRAGSVSTEVVADITAARWTKFVQSCAASGVCGVTRMGYAPATATPAGAELYVRLVREGAAVMGSRGLRPGPYLGEAASVVEVAEQPFPEAVALVRERARRMIEAGYTGGTSLLRDLESGIRSEAEYLMGDMVRIATAAGVDVPFTTAVWLAIAAADHPR